MGYVGAHGIVFPVHVYLRRILAEGGRLPFSRH